MDDTVRHLPSTLLRAALGLSLCSAACTPHVESPVATMVTGAVAVSLAVPASAFHVVIEGPDSDEELRERLELCAAPGFVGLCDRPVVVTTGEARRDTGALLLAIGGRGPGETWGIVRRWDACDRPCSAPSRLTLVRHDGSAWQDVAWSSRFSVDRFEDAQTWLAPWRRDQVLILEQQPAEPEYGLRFSAVGVAPASPTPRFSLRNGARVLLRAVDLLAFETGEVLVLGWSRALEPIIERWSGNTGRSTILDADSLAGCSPLVLWGRSGKAIIVGGTRKVIANAASDGSRTAPCLVRLEGELTTDIPVPRANGMVYAYDREPGGREWIVIGSVERDLWYHPATSELFSREPGATRFVNVPLPRPALSRVRRDPDLEPLDVWAAGDGDVWVLASYVERCVRGVLLHGGARPKGVCALIERSTDGGCSDPRTARDGVVCDWTPPPRPP